MISLISLIILGFLLLITALDLKFKQVPSILLTGFILVALALNYYTGAGALYLGLLSFVLGLLLYEGDFISGVGDIKVITIIGLMLVNMGSFFLFVILLGILGMAWKISLRIGLWGFKPKKNEEFAFFPVLLLCYIALLILGGII